MGLVFFTDAGGPGRRFRAPRRAGVALPILLGSALLARAAFPTGFDPQLRVALSSALAPSNAALSQLTKLSAPHFEIVSLSGLQMATNLVCLDVSGNSISDLSPLHPLSKLISLSLDENSFSVIYPLAGLTNLTSLSLSGNHIDDYRPLAVLTRLVRLSLNGGTLHDLSVLTNLWRLQELRLDYNLPLDLSPLSALTNLTVLDLRWNALGLSPARSSLETLSLLTNLAQLRLTGNDLTNISFLSPLTRLTLLDLGENNLRGLEPLSSLTNLSYLSLSYNKGLTNYSHLASLASLSGLELRGNKLPGLDFLSGVNGLTYLDLAENALNDVSSLAGIANLDLVLDGNAQLDSNSVCALTNLAGLWLGRCSLTDVSFLASLTQLRSLGLNQNGVKALSGIAGLTELTHLNLSMCPISDPNEVSAFSKLSSLGLEGIGLSNSPSFLAGLPALSFLNLSGNRFTDVGPILGLTNLTSLYVSSNRLCSVGLLTNQARLRFLSVGPNLAQSSEGQNMANILRGRWTGFDAASIDYLPINRVTLALVPPMSQEWFVPIGRARAFDLAVSDLVVPANELSVSVASQPPGALNCLLLGGANNNRTLQATPSSGLTGLATLELTVSDSLCGLSASTNIVAHIIPEDSSFNVPSPQLSNLLWSASGLSMDRLSSVDLLNLRSLALADSHLADLRGLEFATNLTSLDLSGNSITNLAPLSNLTGLTSLSLNANLITDLSPLSGLTNLESLELNSNPVTNFLSLASLTSLRSLSLAWDSIIDVGSLTNLPGLNTLNLSFNKICDVSPLRSLTNLDQLDLAQNRLADVAALTNLPHLGLLNVQYNVLKMEAAGALWALQNSGTVIAYEPQRGPPHIDVSTNWVVASGTNSTLRFTITDTGSTTEMLTTHAGPALPGLVIRADFVKHDGFDHIWVLTASATGEALGANRITLFATNDVGLSSNAVMTVVVNDRLSFDYSSLGNSNLLWQTSGNSMWFTQDLMVYGGLPTAQSGPIGHSQSSVLECTNLSGPGTLSFVWRVSSETNFDWLEFVLAGQTNRISGETPWQTQAFRIGSGARTATWRYTKDGNTSSGLDAGWVAQVNFEPDPWLQFAGRPARDQCVLEVHGVPGLPYEVLAATNLSSASNIWFPLPPQVVPSNAVAWFTDTNAVPPYRFYRLRKLP
jgi:Leucine-rich repeat (LRR) protein